MDIKKLVIIPDADNIEKSISLASGYGTGFEYNDFFIPSLMEDEKAFGQRIEFYRDKVKDMPFSTLHGAFLDITVFSDDPKIKAVSDLRVRQSMDAAKALGVKGVIFHTNYMASFLSDRYRDNWVIRNYEYFLGIMKEYPGREIYMENMFDEDPELLKRLAEKFEVGGQFGVCFDYAHAHVFGKGASIEKWCEDLSPYIMHVHINDNDLKEDQHLAVGKGSIDWKAFKDNYNKYFGDASVLLEVRGYDRIKDSLDYIKAL